MRIVGALDLGQEGHLALAAWTGQLASRLGARADLLYVTQDASSSEVDEVRGKLQGLLDTFPEDVRGKPRVAAGKPVEQIIAEARGAAALVVGPRALSTWQRVILGTVAAQVVRRVPAPVFVMRGKELADPPRVLVGLDLDRQTHTPLVERASQWTELLGGKLDAVFVDTQRLPLIRDPAVRHAAQTELDAARTRDKRKLQQLLADLPESIRGEVAVVEAGAPGEALVGMSDGYDLVVVGSMERQGVVQHLLGSVAEYVVSRANCNVLTFPAQLAHATPTPANRR